MVLVPQTPSGMGARGQRDRILGSVGTLVVHASSASEEIAALAGARRVPELTHRFEGEPARQEGITTRLVEHPRLHPDEIRRLPTGTAWVIRRGRVAKVAVSRAPTPPSVGLPRPRRLTRPWAGRLRHRR